MAPRLLLPLLLLTASLLITQAQGIGSSARDCCLKHSRKAIPRLVVTSYKLQGPETECMLRAVVFTTKKNRKICASPTDPTVQGIMQYLDKKVKKNKEKTKGQFLHSGDRPKSRRRQRV